MKEGFTGGVDPLFYDFFISTERKSFFFRNHYLYIKSCFILKSIVYDQVISPLTFYAPGYMEAFILRLFVLFYASKKIETKDLRLSLLLICS